MTLQELTIALSREYIAYRFPDQKEYLDSYERLISYEVQVESPDPRTDRFSPPHPFHEVAVPLVVGMVGAFLVELIKSRLRRKPKPNTEIDLGKLLSTIQRNPGKVRKIMIMLQNNTVEGEITEELLEYSVRVLKCEYERQSHRNT